VCLLIEVLPAIAAYEQAETAGMADGAR